MGLSIEEQRERAIHSLPSADERSACPECGYDRLGESAARCPECGTDRKPGENLARPAGAEVLPVLLLAAGIWLAAYGALVARTYERGVYAEGDRAWRVAVGMLTAGLAAASFLVLRRRARLARLPVEAAQMMIAVLMLLGLFGVGMLIGLLGAGARA